MSQNKIQIYKESDYLELEYKWYSPSAWFFLFFSIFWNAISWTIFGGMLSSGAPLFAIAMLSFHLLAGIGLAYFTLSLFMNKTSIDVTDNVFNMTHGPIPTWKKSHQYDIQDIEQLYVKKKIKIQKGKEKETIILRAKLTEGRDIELLNLPTSKVQDLQKLEEEIEEFLGLVDRRVQGEVPKSHYVDDEHAKRVSRSFTESPLKSVYFAEINDLICLNSEDHRLSNVVQYDWDDGDSDRRLQLLNYRNEERLIYLGQNGAMLNAYEERLLPLATTMDFNFSPADPMRKLEWKGEVYHLSKSKSGKYFAHAQSGESIDSWIYSNTRGDLLIRIEKIGSTNKYYEALQRDQSYFEDKLRLNNLDKEPQILRNGPDYSENDFV